MWAVYALAAAVFAAATSILAKIGLVGVNSNLGTAIRTVVVLFMAWGIALGTGAHRGIPQISARAWVFLLSSGVATGASWLFFFHALQMGPASRVVPIDKASVVITMLMAFAFLGETMDAKTLIGGLLIAAGTIIIALP
ncbi:MAG: EamA family transporter [Treponema sp.]|nr:EamA family transporter [Treponema sp.]